MPSGIITAGFLKEMSKNKKESIEPEEEVEIDENSKVENIE